MWTVDTVRIHDYVHLRNSRPSVRCFERLLSSRSDRVSSCFLNKVWHFEGRVSTNNPLASEPLDSRCWLRPASNKTSLNFDAKASYPTLLKTSRHLSESCLTDASIRPCGHCSNFPVSFRPTLLRFLSGLLAFHLCQPAEFCCENRP